MSLCLDKFLGYVLFDMSVLVCHTEGGFQFDEMVVGGRAHHQLVIALALIRQHVVKELLAISHREVTETALSTGIVLEVLVGCLPISFIGGFVHAHLEVVKKTLLTLGAVEKTKLLIDDGFCTAALDKFRLLEHTAVILLLKLLRGIGVDVESQILTARQSACLRITDRWVEIEIERCLPVLDGSLPYCDFGT